MVSDGQKRRPVMAIRSGQMRWPEEVVIKDGPKRWPETALRSGQKRWPEVARRGGHKM